MPTMRFKGFRIEYINDDAWLLLWTDKHRRTLAINLATVSALMFDTDQSTVFLNARDQSGIQLTAAPGADRDDAALSEELYAHFIGRPHPVDDVLS